MNVSSQHPARDAILLVAGVGGTIVATVVVLAVLIDLLVPLIPASVEANVYAYFASEESEAETEADPRVIQIQTLVDQLASGWHDNPYQFRVYVVDEKTPNAFALPGGSIGVTSGLLDAVATETELAFVLGHEIGHFKGRDHLRGLGRGLAIGMTLSLLTAGGAGGSHGLLVSAIGIAGRQFSRTQESGADAVGLELVWRKYGHVSGATTFFDQLPDPSSEIEEHLDSYLSTHPGDSDRIKALDDLADANGWRRDGVAPTFKIAR